MPINNHPVLANTPLTELIAHAQAELQNLLSGEEFMVRDLFVGYEWNRIPRGTRTKLGAAFNLFAHGNGSAMLAILGKTPQNQQMYRKV